MSSTNRRAAAPKSITRGRTVEQRIAVRWPELAADERHLHNWNVRLGQANAEERVAALLLELRSRLLGLGVDAQERYALPLTQQQIADHVGLTTVHVNRVLRRFRTRNMATVRRGEVVFLENVGALEELARPVQDLVGE